MLREIGEAMLARGYAIDLLYRNMPPQRLPSQGEEQLRSVRPKQHHIRRSLAWTFDRTGRLLMRIGASLRPATDRPEMHGCG